MDSWYAKLRSHLQRNAKEALALWQKTKAQESLPWRKKALDRKDNFRLYANGRERGRSLFWLQPHPCGNASQDIINRILGIPQREAFQDDPFNWKKLKLPDARRRPHSAESTALQVGAMPVYENYQLGRWIVIFEQHSFLRDVWRWCPWWITVPVSIPWSRWL